MNSSRSSKIDRARGSMEVQLRRIYRPAFRMFIEKQVLKYGRVEREDTLLCATNLDGASYGTLELYLDELTCSMGRFQVTKDADGREWIELKPQFRVNASPGTSSKLPLKQDAENAGNK